MNNPRPAAKKEKVKKEKNDIAMKDIRNLFRLEKENETIKEKAEQLEIPANLMSKKEKAITNQSK